MCAGCERRLPATGTRFMLTIRTDHGGDEVAFCTAECRRRWCAGAGRRASGQSPRKAA